MIGILVSSETMCDAYSTYIIDSTLVSDNMFLCMYNSHSFVAVVKVYIIHNIIHKTKKATL